MPAVIGSRTFQCLMARLALAAMLLVALAPTVSRTLQAPAAPGGAVMRLVEMCTAAGMQARLLPAMPAAPGGHDGGQPTNHPDPHAAGDACGYCSLTVPPPVLLLLACMLLALLPAAPSFRFRAFVPRSLRNLRGLGAQAPPLAL